MSAARYDFLPVINVTITIKDHERIMIAKDSIKSPY